MTRQAFTWTIGLAIGMAGVAGCLRPTQTAGPESRHLPNPSEDAKVARAAATASYHPFPAPLPDRVAEETFAPKNDTERRELAPPLVERVTKPVPTEVPEAAGPTAGDRSSAFPLVKPVTEHPLVAALQCRLDKRPDEMRRLLKDYDEGAQSFIVGLLDIVSRFAHSEPFPTTSPDNGELIEDLTGVLQPLRMRAPLKIEKMCFCNRIKTFGVFEPLNERAQFRPGDQVHIYVELRNFGALEKKQLDGEVRHIIKLASSYEIHDESQNIAHKAVFLRDREAADESRTPRNDYFENYVFTVPKLKPGTYTLVIQIDDLSTAPARTVKGSLDFQVPSSPVQITRGPDRESDG